MGYNILCFKQKLPASLRCEPGFARVMACNCDAMDGWLHPVHFYLDRPIGRCIDIAAELLINEEIRDREVRVIGADGAQLGILPLRKALELAEEAELDLVKIVPTAQPPVCKLMDYDKHRFEQSKREREMRKNQKVISVKEMRLSATIDIHDMEVKAKNVSKFLAGGDKVKVSIRFRGRQLSHTEQGLNVMETFLGMLDNANVEKPAKMEGRNMFMILAPKN